MVIGQGLASGRPGPAILKSPAGRFQPIPFQHRPPVQL